MHAVRAVHRGIAPIVSATLRSLLFSQENSFASFVRSFDRSLNITADRFHFRPSSSPDSELRRRCFISTSYVTYGLTLSREASLSRKKHGVRADTEIVKGHGSFAFTVGSYDKSCDAARDCCIKFRPTRGRRGVIPGDTPRLTTSIREADLLS